MLEKRGRKAQLTLFIIIAVVVIAIGLTVFFISRNRVNNQQIPADIEEVKLSVQNCLEQTSRESLILVGFQGGYSEPREYIETNISKVAYWYKNGKNIKPTTEKIESEISEYIDFSLPICFDANSDNNLNISHNQSYTQTKISDNKVYFETNFPILIKKDDTSFMLNKFEAEITSNLSKIYNLSSFLTREHALNNGIVNISNYLNSGFDYVIIPYYEAVIYAIYDNSSNINNEDYIFMFALETK